MTNRCYVAPVQPGVNTYPIASLIASHLAQAPIQSVFEANLPQPTDWLINPKSAALEVIEKLETSGNAVFHGSFSSLLPGTDILSIHAQIAAHLQAPLVVVVDAKDLNSDQVTQAAHLAARSAFDHHAYPIASIIINADFTPQTSGGHTPVIAVPGLPQAEDLEPLHQVLAQVPTLGLPPVAYQATLIDRARSQKKTIVLPESEDDRILQAAAELLKLQAANLILLGDAGQVTSRASQLGIDLEGVQIVDPTSPELIARYAPKLAELRAKKGVTEEKARQLLQDSAYFGTMMIVCQDADGMVSGAAHTTANTIRPALQLIKTKPGTKTVSGAFLMLFADRQHLYADCAVSIDPDAQQLADIALTSAQTAQVFGIEPKVAMISYSTGDSGSGESVDKVKAATALAHEAQPELVLDGPLQFDAAVDPTVAKKKLPDSKVAGQANVFVFNHLDVGNCTYKAVQRTSGAVAVGPILQGLNAPVNDLSRGALVEDIVNTVIITAIQAQA